MITPIDFLSQFKADPLDPASPLLLVSKGDLDTDQARYVTGARYSNRAYALYLESANAELFEYADEQTERITVFDVVLEMRCTAAPTPAQQHSLLELWTAVSAMPRKVTHLYPNLPLSPQKPRLKVPGGLGSPRTMTDPQNWLTAGWRFEAYWQANY